MLASLTYPFASRIKARKDWTVEELVKFEKIAKSTNDLSKLFEAFPEKSREVVAKQWKVFAMNRKNSVLAVQEYLKNNGSVFQQEPNPACDEDEIEILENFSKANQEAPKYPPGLPPPGFGELCGSPAAEFVKKNALLSLIQNDTNEDLFKLEEGEDDDFLDKLQTRFSY